MASQTSSLNRRIPYGTSTLLKFAMQQMMAHVALLAMTMFDAYVCSVRLGNSGLKVSKIILGCMSYGDPAWQNWVLGEEEGIKHIKYAYVATFRCSFF